MVIKRLITNGTFFKDIGSTVLTIYTVLMSTQSKQ